MLLSINAKDLLFTQNLNEFLQLRLSLNPNVWLTQFFQIHILHRNALKLKPRTFHQGSDFRLVRMRIPSLIYPPKFQTSINISKKI